MSKWIQLGEDALINLDKAWHVSVSTNKRKEYEIRFLVEMQFPDPQQSTQDKELWHEVRENFLTKEDMMIAFSQVSNHLNALDVDQAVKDFKANGK